MKKVFLSMSYIYKNIKKTGLIVLIMTFFNSCATYHYKEVNIGTDQPEQGYGKACPTPKYVATEYAYSTMAYSSSHLSVAQLLAQAKDKHGNNVTIQNIHWDLVNGIRISATYDVITCIEEEGITPVKK